MSLVRAALPGSGSPRVPASARVVRGTRASEGDATMTIPAELRD